MRAALEQHILHVLGECELEHTRRTSCALPAPATCAPPPLSHLLVLGELEEGVEEPVHHFLYDPRLDLVVQTVQPQVGCGVHDVERGVEVERTMRKYERASVDEAERKV